jgi:hypothetical protein
MPSWADFLIVTMSAIVKIMSAIRMVRWLVALLIDMYRAIRW